jgi:ABC-2 type transport system permease protein
MSYVQLIRSELRKLTSTKMPWVFLAVLGAIAAINASAVIWGTDFGGSKAFVSTAADQQSLVAFASNAIMIAGLFGAIAVAREYAHQTVIPTFLAEPRRHRAVLSQLSAVSIAGGLVGLIGAALTTAAVALSVPTTEYSFLVSAGGVTRVLLASTFAGAAGAVLGAGLGTIVRNTGEAVTATVLVLIITPPLIVQLISDSISWIPATLGTVLAGVAIDTDISTLSAALALALWAVVPAAIGLAAVTRRDIA